MSGAIEEALLNLCVKNNVKISLAESCTGGTIASRITSIPGASQYFIGAIICYDNAIKTNILKVSDAQIAKYSVVSEQVAIQMALGVKTLLNTDFALSTTGVASPASNQTVPVGTVYIGLALPNNQTICLHNQFVGKRINIITQAANVALRFLFSQVEQFYSGLVG